MNLPHAITKIQAAVSAISKWDGEPDEELRHALLEGFWAAHELAAPEDTTSPRAQPRRDRLDNHRFVAKIIGLASLNEQIDRDPVAVARAAAYLGGLVVRIMQEDFLEARKHRKVLQKGGKRRGGYELEEIRQGWITYATRQAEKSPKVCVLRIARKIYRDKNLNRAGKALGTINNYLVANRNKWDPSRR